MCARDHIAQLVLNIPFHSYEQGYKLSGIVYLHRISDNRITGTARRNFNMFRKLCGDSTLHNVVIVTNMWGKVTPELGASRELELATDDRLFKPALSQGARMLRHNNTISSAHAILLSLLSNRPKALRIQEELVDERKDIADTDAGQELGRELAELAIQYRAQLDQVQKDLEEALRTKDIQTEKELEQIRKDLEGQINQLEHDRERISNDYAEKKRKTDEKMHEILESLKEEQGRRAQREQEISRLMRSADASAEDRARYTQELCELDEDTGPGIFSVIGKVLDDVLGIAAAFVAAGSMTMI